MKKLLILGLLLISACSNSFFTDKVTVLVAVPPYVRFVEAIGGDAVRVRSIMPETADPHTFEASPKDAQYYKETDLWVSINGHFEKRSLAATKKMNPKLLVVELLKDSSADPHIWMSPRLAKQQGDAIYDALVKLKPERKEYFEQNLADFKDKLNEVDATLTKQLKPYAGRTIVTAHDSFGYFCIDYNLKQLEIEQEGKSPLPKNLSTLVERAKDGNAICVITQPQFSNRASRRVAEMLHLPIHEVNPLSPNYFTTLINLGEAIASD
ncbi:MAG: High-affinity zinc uptake system binding-protein ZnuA [Chlamydiia bacterium]|nr:High-affinity zinc uptake system binding-protein ZnuA [Chlamydiia bacterium]MCH9616161.1 High-affinity zinc uptake system binding-protein ZnuA [Chlamydiia bacterium]MCH9629853.1 High-affinity zinc uptake system binding-protein ZnuA [Chlamydiia bacterium]